MRPKTRDDFEVAIICALPLEADAVEALFDERYDRFGRYYGKQPGDANAYLNGRIGEHNVVLCYLPGMGKGSAASVASSMKVSYTRVQLALVVGICGGSPSPGYGEIFLGDVLISDSMVEYDFGRQYPGGFRRKTDVKDTLGRPNREIRTLLAGLRSKYARQEIQEQTDRHLHVISKVDERWHRPQLDDNLFAASCLHKHSEPSPSGQCICTCGIPDDICNQALEMSCDALRCDKSQVIRCRQASSSIPVSIHIGTIACADTVMKSGQHRDAITKEEKVIGFEMEGAGVWDNCSCIIIKGVCDYADSHKSKTWQSYAAATGACAAKAFLQLWRAQKRETTKSRHLMIPFMRNPRFVGRHNEIQQVLDWIQDSQGPRKLAITGLGGVGKTQIALEVAYRVQDADDECSIFWIPCTSNEALEQAIMSIMRTVGIEVSPSNVNECFKAYFNQNEGNWLLIFDNADDTAMWTQASESNPPLVDFLPPNSAGHIIFTSRNRELAVDLASSSLVQIKELDEETGMKLLRKTLPKHLVPDSSTAITLLEQLTFLPLAISQATAYMTKKGIPASEYLALFREQEEDVIELLSTDFGDDGRYKESQNPVAKTWLISFRHVRTTNPLAAQLLSLMACIDPRNIPKAFFAEFESKLKMTDALGVLNAFSFITTDIGNGSITLHRLVHLATRNWVRKEGHLQSYVTRAAERLDLMFPEDNTHMHEHRQTWRGFMPHALSLLSHKEFENIDESFIPLIFRIGACLKNDGRYREALKQFLRALELQRRTPAPKHHDTLCIVFVVAQMYMVLGQSKEADEMLVHMKNTLTEIGPKLAHEYPGELDHISTSIAKVYSSQGKWKEAGDILQQLIDTWQQAVGLEHLNNSDMMTNLAIACTMQSRWKESELMILKAIDIEKRVLGQTHPKVLIVMSVLAVVLIEQDRLKEAQELIVQTSDALNQVLGSDLPDTLTARSHLTQAPNARSQLKEAEELFIQALRALKQVLGSDHHDALVDMTTFMRVFEAQGRSNKAAGELSKMIATAKTMMQGPNDPDTLNANATLACRLAEQGQLQEAEALLVQTLKSLREILGVCNLETLRAQGYLARVFERQGQLTKAKELFKQTLGTLRNELICDNIEITGMQEQLANLLQKQGQFKEAEDLLVQALNTNIRMRHPDVCIASTKNSLAWVLQKQNRLKESEELFVQTLGILKKALVSNHPATLTSQGDLAFVLKEQGRLQEAESLFVQTLDALRKRIGSDHPETLNCMYNLALVWRSVGNTQAALDLMKECAERRSEVLGQDDPDTVETFDALRGLETKDVSAHNFTKYCSKRSADVDSFCPGDSVSRRVSAKRRKC